MDRDRQRKLRQLFARAFDLQPEARGRLLDEACAGDPELRREIEALLERDDDVADRIGGVVQGAASDALAGELAPSLLTGQDIAGYQIRQKLGEGGMGEVFLAHDVELRRDVALKVLPAPIAKDPESLRRFKREARALAAVDHPNIVSVYSVEEANDVHFLTMAYVDGRTLDELIPRGGLGYESFLDLAVPLADALRAAHERGIIHRDLKPANVMVDGDDRLRVLDFGLAKLQGDAQSPVMSQAPTKAMTREGVVMGTFPYMSPEQTEGKALDARSDIFSLGVILYEMATGQRPFKGETSASLIAAILKEAPPALETLRTDLPEPLDRLLARCLEKDPERRPQSAKDVRNELEQLRREANTQASASVIAGAGTAMSRRSVTAVSAATLIVLALLVVLWDRSPISLGPASPPGIRSLAVLPLSNLSRDPDQLYFVDGMTEALITDLARIRSLKVISRTSSMLYRDTPKPLPEIARELGVDAVVEGSVIRSDDMVRVTVQLIEAESDEHIWAENFDREMRDIFSLQSEVARAIARQIEARLTPAEEELLMGGRSVNPEAYDAFLRGQFHLFSLNPEDIERAKEYYERALEIDPGFALAYTGLAHIYGGRVQWGRTPAREGLLQVRELTLRALDLDDTLAEAHNSLAKVFFYEDWDWEAAEAAFRRGIELSPNSPFLRMTYSLMLGSLQRHGEGVSEIEQAIEMDPLNPLWKAVRAWQMMFQEQYAAAIDEFRRTLSVAPNVLPAQEALWVAFWRQQEWEEAREAAKKAFSLRGRLEVVEAIESGYAESGNPEVDYRDAMRSGAERLVELSSEAYVLPSLIAKLYVQAGEHDRALDWLGKAYEERDPFMVHLRVDPTWVDLRGDPRFRDLLEGIGLPELEDLE